MINSTSFFTSNWNFDEMQLDLKNRFQMINVALILSTLGLIFGIIINVSKHLYIFVPIEIVLLCINIILFIALRFSKKLLNIVTVTETIQFTFLFIFLIYASDPQSLKHVWIFTYPIILLYFQNEKSAIYWVSFMVAMLLIAPLQPFIAISYSLFQVTYISFVLVLISIIIYFYQKKIDEAKHLILSQQRELHDKIDELTQKDKLLTMQSKQAVMGEMISMIAHQWRQPLSTVTLSISNIQIKKLLGESIEEELIYKTLQEINNTVVYLSDTIDDFQTYFKPNKEVHKVSIDFIITKAINFTKVRLKSTNIKIEINSSSNKLIDTYSNELIQVILNILNNAIDELKSLNMKNPMIIVNVVDENEFYNLKIQDNADGIKADHIEQVFEPYFSTKDKNGTGLGLYMSQMIMQKQFNSKIEVSSSENGSTFTIKVPKKLS